MLRLDHAELALDVDQQPPQALFDAQRLEQDLLVRGGHVHVARDAVGERAGLGHWLERLAQRRLGDAAQRAELVRSLTKLAPKRHERGVFGVDRLHVFDRHHGRLGVAVALAELNGGARAARR